VSAFLDDSSPAASGRRRKRGIRSLDAHLRDDR
jgi:hypothetical protein